MRSWGRTPGVGKTTPNERGSWQPQGDPGASGSALLDLDSIAEAAAHGDKRAMETVYRELAPKIRGYLSVRGAGDPDALTNDVFVQILQQLDGLTGGWAGLKTFAFTVAHGRLVDSWRRATHRTTDEYVPESDPRRAISAEHEALERIQSQEILDVLDLLPADQKNVITLRVLAELTLEQTASVLGRSNSWVSDLQAKALGSLRFLLADHAASRGGDR